MTLVGLGSISQAIVNACATVEVNITTNNLKYQRTSPLGELCTRVLYIEQHLFTCDCVGLDSIL